MRPVTLVCLPYAGGSAAVFRDWSRELPSWVKILAIDLPGHGTRTWEQSLNDWDGLVKWLLTELQALRTPFAIFGHSMGALVGLELAHALRERLQREPLWLGVAGCVAPARRVQELKWLECAQDEIVDELRELGGTPQELLDSPEMLDLIVPTLRNDFHLCGSYRRREREALSCPLLVLGGAQDRDVSNPVANLAEWKIETSGSCRVMLVPGNHFFIDRNRSEVLRAIVPSLDAARYRERLHA